MVTETYISRMILIYIAFMLLLKLMYKFIINKNFNKNIVLNKKICPFCKHENSTDYRICSNCKLCVSKDQKNIVCHNCGYFGEMDRYVKNSEFTITILTIWPFIPFSIIYYLTVRNKLICKSCGRITRKKDYKIC